MTARILVGHVLDQLAGLKSQSVHCVVTSPPYYGLRAYGTDPQIWGGDPSHDHAWGEPERAPWANDVPGPNTGGKNGARNLSKLSGAFCACGAWLGELGGEPTPELFIEHMVTIFREVRRVLRADGTCWINIGDSYAGSGKGPTGHNGIGDQGQRQGFVNSDLTRRGGRGIRNGTGYELQDRGTVAGCKPKDLIGIPWMLAFALRADGWWLRSDIRWCKRAPMPESVRDRPTSAVEDIFLLSKAERYFYDDVAARERAVSTHPSGNGYDRPEQISRGGRGQVQGWQPSPDRHGRNFWLLGPEPFPEAHFATFVTEIPRRCISAGTSERGCCPMCHAPWARVVDRTGRTARQQADEAGYGPSAVAHGDNPQGLSFKGSHWKLPPRETIDHGWQPTCDCPPVPPVPCVVLDPFGGAGTTGLVADRLGRDAILIELNPEFAAMARRRIAEDAPMFTNGVVS